VELVQFKREVYHKVFDVILQALKGPSCIGEAIKCGDMRRRIVYPGIFIQAIDMEEACAACGTRRSKANHPCPRCLVPKDMLHSLSHSFPLRTQAGMIDTYRKAKGAVSNVTREQILQDSGLHLVKV
jgi:hypothetical protein